MTQTARRRMRTALYALCTLLLAQWTLSTHACPVIRSAGEAIQIAVEVAAAPEHPCHGSTVSAHQHAQDDITSDLGGLCAKHCVGEEASTSSGALAVPVDTRVLRFVDPADTTVARAPIALHARDAHAPPLNLLYCVSLT